MRWFRAIVCAFLFGTCISYRTLPKFNAGRFGLASKSVNLNPMDQSGRAGTPSRNDECKVLISGVVGTPPKEIYLKNGHYVLNFALAVVGHFKAVHQQEYYKPAETMWISVELWDDLAKSHYADIKKGHVLRGVGYLILNKWIDKLNGEERKMYKMRVTKLLSSEEFGTVNALLEDTVGATRSGTGVLVDDSDSAFASDHPALPDQSSDEHTRAELYGYRPRPPSVAVPPRPAAYPAKALTLGQDGRSAPSVSSSRSTAGPSQAGAEVWDLLDNAREGEYLPWWE